MPVSTAASRPLYILTERSLVPNIPLGIPELIVLSPLLAAFILLPLTFRRRARRLGYPTTAAYLRAVPRSDIEKRDAADLALKGLVFCLLAIVFPPFIVIGLIPLFYGGRKLVYSSLGLGLVDDADHPGA